MRNEQHCNDKILRLTEKYGQFFSDTSSGQILATICPYTFPLDYGAWGLPGRRLDSWDFERDMLAFVRLGVDRHRAFMEYTKDLDNDYVPAHGVNFGYGVHSAYFTGQDVIMGDDTSWTHPWLEHWEDINKLAISEDNTWLQKILECYGHLKSLCDGDYAISAFANAGPGDMANAIRGNELFYDLFDNPQHVHTLMDKCADAVIWLESKLRGITGYVNGGTVTANVWFPGDTPYISEDFNDLCSEEQYEQFGFKYTKKILDHFGGAYIHHHAKGFHIHSKVASLRKLSMVEISLDPNCERPVDRLCELFEMNSGVPLMIRCHARDVYQHIDALKRGRIVIMLNVDSLDEGRDVMRFIRKNSII